MPTPYTTPTEPLSLDSSSPLSKAQRSLAPLTLRYGIPVHAQTLPSAYLRAALPMHLKLRGGGRFVPDPSAAKSPIRTPKRRRIHRTTHPPPPSSSKQTPARLQVDGAFASQVQSSVSSTCRLPEASLEDTFRSTVTAPVAAVAGASSGAGAGVKPLRRTSPPLTGGHGLTDSGKHSPELRTTAGGEDLVFGPEGGRGGGGDSGGTWSNATSGMISSEQNAPDSRRAGEDNEPAAGWESAWDTKRESRGLTGDAGSRFPGSSARQDMPSGLKECVERLCAAAFLRGHVPEGLMPKGTTPAEAYQRCGSDEVVLFSRYHMTG